MNRVLLPAITVGVLVSMASSLNAQTGDSATANWEREAAAAAVALLEAEGRLPTLWIAAPFEIRAGEGPGFHLNPSLGLVHASREERDPRAVFACDQRECRFLPGLPGRSTPVMTRRVSSDASGVTLLVEWPSSSERVGSEVRYAVSHATVRVDRDVDGNPVPRFVRLVSTFNLLIRGPGGR